MESPPRTENERDQEFLGRELRRHATTELFLPVAAIRIHAFELPSVQSKCAVRVKLRSKVDRRITALQTVE